MCDIGIETVCKMIFENNFVHGDLHPGNVLITDEKIPKFALLDAGIARRFARDDYDVIVGVLAAFIRMDGGLAADLLVKDSVARLDTPPENVASFRAVLAKISEDARANTYFFDQIGNYVVQLCSASAEHHVLMNQTFVSISLTVRVMEGLALQLNEEAKIWKIANKVSLNHTIFFSLFIDDD